jgi:hypothetical protein
MITSVLGAKLIDHHGGRRHPTAAMVPTTRLQGIETLANILCDKAM